MNIESIFLNSDWDEASQQLFWETLKKKRQQKLFYVSRKANNLSKNGAAGLNQAIGLLLHFVDDFINNQKAILSKNKYPRLYINDIADFCMSISKWHAKLGDLSKVDEFGQLAVNIYESHPDDPELSANRAFDGYIDLAYLYIDLGEAKKADNMLDKFEQKLDRRDNRYPLAKCRSRLAWLDGNWKKAEKCWLSFYKSIGSHKTWKELETQPYINIMEQEEADPLMSGEAIVVYHHSVIPEIFDKNRTALEKLDGLLKGLTKTNDGEDYSFYGYSSEFVEKHLLPELGAYLGEVWVKSLSGKWIPDTLLMKFRVDINGKLYNPFEYAYKALYWNYRLHEECYGI